MATEATRRDSKALSTTSRGESAWAVHAAPRAFGRYELLGEVATGGMATVYLGRMRRPMGFSRLVAIKSMHPHYAKDPSFVTMFVDEARLTARLRHPNIVQTLDIVEGGGQLVIVMEYVEGVTLGTLWSKAGTVGEKLPAPIACAMIQDLLLGLHAAHEARDDDGTHLAIIHRDVSPQNVIVGLDGLTRVLDFGVAKARRRVHSSLEGEIKGKLPYMPAEQLFGEAIDHRVDVYAAGVLLWESLTGTRLFDGPTDEVLVRRITDGDIAAPSSIVPGIPAALDAVVMRALASSPADRFASALAMAEALAQAAPVASRTEVAAWTQRFVERREIPSVAPPADEADPMMSAVVDTLDRAAPPAKVEPRTWPRTVGVVVLSFLASVAVGMGMRTFAATAAAPASAALTATAPVATATVNAATTAAQTASAAATASAPAVMIGSSQRPSPHVAIAKRNAASAAPTGATATGSGAAVAPITAAPASEPTPAQVDAKPASCRPPYTLDAEGHRHYKVECL